MRTATAAEPPRDRGLGIAVAGPRGRLRPVYASSYKPMDGPLVVPAWDGDGHARRRIAYGRMRPGYATWVAYVTDGGR